MPNWNDLNPAGVAFNPMREVKQETATKLYDKADVTVPQSAVHQIIGGSRYTPMKWYVPIPQGYVPHLSVVGDNVVVEFREKAQSDPLYRAMVADDIVKDDALDDAAFEAAECYYFGSPGDC